MSKDYPNQGIDPADVGNVIIDVGILPPEAEGDILRNPELKRAMHAVLWGGHNPQQSTLNTQG